MVPVKKVPTMVAAVAERTIFATQSMETPFPEE
jgi:hypothetical protein